MTDNQRLKGIEDSIKKLDSQLQNLNNNVRTVSTRVDKMDDTQAQTAETQRKMDLIIHQLMMERGQGMASPLTYSSVAQISPATIEGPSGVLKQIEASPSGAKQNMDKQVKDVDPNTLRGAAAPFTPRTPVYTSDARGMNKMVINHLDKLFVTNDAATIVNELEVQHPAAKILVLAGKAQQEEIGDGANLTVSFAGELLQNAEDLIRMGLHPSEIIIGYTKAINKTIEILDDLVEKGSENMNVRGKDEVMSRMRAAVASKQFGLEDVLCPLVAEACIQVCPKNPSNFNVDNVRVAKLLGGGLHNSTIIRGMVLKGDAVGSIKKIEKSKVAVFAQGVDTSATETKGTVLIHSAEQLESYSKTEEAKVEELIKAVADSGAKVIVSGGAVGEMALHFCERYKLMVLKISSKFELRRFCHTTGAVAILKLSQPNPDDLGYVDSVSVEEIGGVRVTVVRNEEGGNSVSTIVLRGSTDSILDDLERAVDDGVNTYKAMCRDSRIVPGAAATEIELAKKLKEFSFKETGLDQYAIAKFAESFEMVPKTLSGNAGLNAMEIISSLYAEHASGNIKVGVNLEKGVCEDVSTMNVWDLYITKFFALKYAADAVCTVLRVDQIIMAKPAGGPSRRDQPAGMDED